MASRIGLGGPFGGTVTSAHNSPPLACRHGSVACSGRKNKTGSLKFVVAACPGRERRNISTPSVLEEQSEAKRPFSTRSFPLTYALLKACGRRISRGDAGAAGSAAALSQTTSSCNARYRPRIGRSGSYTPTLAHPRGNRWRSHASFAPRLATIATCRAPSSNPFCNALMPRSSACAR
jgi:hypothetical protein